MCCGLRLRCVWLLLTVLVVCCLFLPASPKAAEAARLSCGPFAGAPSPQPRQVTRPPQRIAEIEAEASARSFPVVFLGDSLTQLLGPGDLAAVFNGISGAECRSGGRSHRPPALASGERDAGSAAPQADRAADRDERPHLGAVAGSGGRGGANDFATAPKALAASFDTR